MSKFFKIYVFNNVFLKSYKIITFKNYFFLCQKKIIFFRLRKKKEQTLLHSRAARWLKKVQLNHYSLHSLTLLPCIAVCGVPFSLFLIFYFCKEKKKTPKESEEEVEGFLFCIFHLSWESKWLRFWPKPTWFHRVIATSNSSIIVARFPTLVVSQFRWWFFFFFLYC